MIFFANWFIFIDNNELNDKTFIIKSQIVTIKDGKKKTSVMVLNYMKERGDWKIVAIQWPSWEFLERQRTTII
jgi:hypothetical protein